MQWGIKTKETGKRKVYGAKVDSGYIISGLSDIDRAIHTKGKNDLHPKVIEQIIMLLKGMGINHN